MKNDVRWTFSFQKKTTFHNLTHSLTVLFSISFHVQVISCGQLPTPGNGRKSTFAFTPGTKVQFDCDPGYVLVGERRRWCYDSGDWNWPELGTAECIPEAQYNTMQVRELDIIEGWCIDLVKLWSLKDRREHLHLIEVCQRLSQNWKFLKVFPIEL